MLSPARSKKITSTHTCIKTQKSDGESAASDSGGASASSGNNAPASGGGSGGNGASATLSADNRPRSSVGPHSKSVSVNVGATGAGGSTGGLPRGSTASLNSGGNASGAGAASVAATGAGSGAEATTDALMSGAR